MLKENSDAKTIVFCWSDISGYMAACWRALAKKDDINLFIIAFQAKTETAFDQALMTGIPSKLLSLEERQDRALIENLVTELKPDILVVSGWLHPPYRHLLLSNTLSHIPCIMGMDTPWQGTWKQRLAPFLLSRYLKRMTQVVVTGERSWIYAHKLGISPEKIRKGLYGIDYDRFSDLWQTRQNLARQNNQNWPRSFLFLGRYNPIKGLDILVQAYQHYRQSVEQPWDLICCGQGDLEHLLRDQPGISNQGFVQPTDLPQVLKQAGVLILPSRFDPWPLALVEAAAAGLPILCTDACGSAVEVVRQGYNGWITATGSVPALAQTLIRIHQTTETSQLDLTTWGKRSQSLAAPYSAQVWADHWHTFLTSSALRTQH